MLNLIEEAEFAELRAKCKKLKVPAPPEIFIGLKVHDKNGVLTFDDIQRGHSWTRNFYNALYGVSSKAPSSGTNNYGAGYMTAKQTSNSNSYSSNYSCMLGTTATAGFTNGIINGAADASCGIVIGTGDTAFSVEQYALTTIIAHGNSSGQMAYQIMGFAVSAYTAGTKTWKSTITRLFNNNSGGSITVKETGLYAYSCLFGSNNLFYMFERSVLDPTVAVANGAQLTVTYEISMDFSAID